MPNNDFQNGIILGAAAGKPKGSSITVDATLSTESENPVQNKVVTQALNGKADLAGCTFSGQVNMLTSLNMGYQGINNISDPYAEDSAISKKWFMNGRPNWEQNDEDAPDYIKNRICYETTTTTTDDLIFDDPSKATLIDMDEGVYLFYPTKIGLVTGTTYSAGFSQIGTEISYSEIECTESPLADGNVAATLLLYTEDENTLAIIDGTDPETFGAGDSCAIILMGEFASVVSMIQVGIKDITQTISEIKQIDRKFIPPCSTDWNKKEHKIGTYFEEDLYEKSFLIPSISSISPSLTFDTGIEAGSIIYIEDAQLLGKNASGNLVKIYPSFYKNNTNRFSATLLYPSTVVFDIGAMDEELSSSNSSIILKVCYTKSESPEPPTPTRQHTIEYPGDVSFETSEYMYGNITDNGALNLTVGTRYNIVLTTGGDSQTSVAFATSENNIVYLDPGSSLSGVVIYDNAIFENGSTTPTTNSGKYCIRIPIEWKAAGSFTLDVVENPI